MSAEREPAADTAAEGPFTAAPDAAVPQDAVQQEIDLPLVDDSVPEFRVFPEPPEPGWFKRTLHSTGFYICLMLAIVLLMWAAKFKLDDLGTRIGRWAVAERKDGDRNLFEYVPALFNWFGYIAGFITILAGLVIILRIFRGSLLDARKELREDLRYAHLTGGIEPSNRLGESIITVMEDGDEKLLWESKLHPISIPVYAWRGMRKTPFLRAVSTAYLIGMPVVAFFWGWWWLAMLGGLAMYLGYFVIEWRRDCYAVTDRRIVAVTKLVATRSATMPRVRLTDVVVDTPATAKVLAWLRFIDLPWGTLDVESAGQDQALKKVHYLTGIEVIVAALRLALPV